jgi:hypothetical protein
MHKVFNKLRATATATSSQYLAVNCEPIVWTVWNPRRLTTL